MRIKPGQTLRAPSTLTRGLRRARHKLRLQGVDDSLRPPWRRAALNIPNYHNRFLCTSTKA